MSKLQSDALREAITGIMTSEKKQKISESIELEIGMLKMKIRMLKMKICMLGDAHHVKEEMILEEYENVLEEMRKSSLQFLINKTSTEEKRKITPNGAPAVLEDGDTGRKPSKSPNIYAGRRWNWFTKTYSELPDQATEEIVNEGEKALVDEKPAAAGEEEAAEIREKPTNEHEEIREEPEDKEMTLQEYENVLEEKRKSSLQVLINKTSTEEKRKVDTRSQFEAMIQLPSKKAGDDQFFIKLGSEKKKKKNKDIKLKDQADDHEHEKIVRVTRIPSKKAGDDQFFIKLGSEKKKKKKNKDIKLKDQADDHEHEKIVRVTRIPRGWDPYRTAPDSIIALEAIARDQMKKKITDASEERGMDEDMREFPILGFDPRKCFYPLRKF